MKLLKAAIGVIIEGIVNPILRLDPELKYLLEPLQGQRLAVKITDFNLRLIYSVEGTKLRVGANDYATADVELTGHCIDLMRLAFAENPQPILAQKSVSLLGSTAILQGYQRLIHQLDFDWEGHLSALIGPIAAHEIGELARKAKSFHKSASAETKADITEYLQEEMQCLPPREAVEDFYEDIALLQQDVERLCARI